MAADRKLAKRFLASRVESTCRDVANALGSMAADIRKELTAVERCNHVSSSFLQHATRLADAIGRYNALREAQEIKES